MLVAPYWESPGHVGFKRAARFARWIVASGRELVIVRAGPESSVRLLRPDLSSTPCAEAPADTCGRVVTVRDPLGLKVYMGSAGSPGPEGASRTTTGWKSSLVTLAFNPDATAAWARKAAGDASVAEHCRGAEWVVASSPPEACHLASYWISRQTGARLCVDMRDGWLDEPLKPLLQRWAWRRWLEGRWESRVLRRAEQVFVTSDVWMELLNNRLPFTRGKTAVLTNAYPPGPHPEPPPLPKRERLKLIHAGRLAGSRNTQTMGALVSPLMASLGDPWKADVQMVGSLNTDDLAEMERMRPVFEAAGWTLSHHAAVPYAEMQERLRMADGLLLLCASRAPIPSKLFDYIPTRRPIFCVTPATSALARAVADIPQAVCVDPSGRDSHAPLASRFLAMCHEAPARTAVPERFSDEALSRVFTAALDAARPE